jgi:hypothetical protein
MGIEPSLKRAMTLLRNDPMRVLMVPPARIATIAIQRGWHIAVMRADEQTERLYAA